MSYIAEALNGCSIVELVVLGVLGFGIFYGVLAVCAEIMDLFSGR